MPRYPECWESCGNCASGEVIVQSLLVRSGDQLQVDDTILVLETGKVALDIPSPRAGEVIDVLVREGDAIVAEQLLILLAIS